MNNLMPGDNSGAEPREHDRQCAADCIWAVFEEFTDGACPDGHTDHSCDCDEIAASRAESEASAAAEHLAEITSSPAL